MKLDLEGIVGHNAFEIKDKLEECRFFLEMMKHEVEWPAIR
jgi:hypothetical protein